MRRGINLTDVITVSKTRVDGHSAFALVIVAAQAFSSFDLKALTALRFWFDHGCSQWVSLVNLSLRWPSSLSRFFSATARPPFSDQRLDANCEGHLS